MRLSGTGNNCGNGRRKISNEACEALMNCRTYRNSNTIVFRDVDSEDEVWWAMTLFGNNIATYVLDKDRYGKLSGGHLYICDGGYQSVTTKERLNALPNVHIYQKDYQWYLNDKKWDGNNTRIITPAEELIGQTTKELEEARQISHMEKVQSAYEKLRSKAI
jgi:hypothetical protein